MEIIVYEKLSADMILRAKLVRMRKLFLGSGMKATAQLPSRAKKAELEKEFSCICSNEFKILFLLIL